MRTRSAVVGIAAMLAVALASAPAEAKECREETPLPADVALVPPGPDVPAAMARFAGAWVGAWKGRWSDDHACQTLVVEEVLAPGFARVIYSHGTYEPLGIRQPNFWRATGRIADGVLRFRLPFWDRPELAYRFEGESLLGTYRGEGRAVATRVDDVRGVRCRPQPGRRRRFRRRRHRATVSRWASSRPPWTPPADRSTTTTSCRSARPGPRVTPSAARSGSRPLACRADGSAASACPRRSPPSPPPSSPTAIISSRSSATS